MSHHIAPFDIKAEAARLVAITPDPDRARAIAEKVRAQYADEQRYQRQADHAAMADLVARRGLAWVATVAKNYARESR